MDGYKHIETCIGRYIAGKYARAVEVGIGKNPGAARILADEHRLLLATDVKSVPVPDGIPFAVDDIFAPDLSRYRGADVIYAIRPAVEMVPPLIALAEKTGCDLIVYHLGFETWGDGGETIDCGVLLHRYHTA